MLDMRVIAMYLPQFHRVKENDEWWGEGFTEWTAVKNAKPLFEGHVQPEEPLNDNYYDLMDKKTMIWQSSLAQKYNIYGFSFYHYWFKNGRKILEKPAENLLRWKDIKIPFCFTWANESWARSWSNISNHNAWADIFEQEKDINGSAILLEQKYGLEKDWKRHFDYLLPFFMDDRYIKIDGKPLFVFYKPDMVPSLPRMIRYWRKLADDAHLLGIYFMGINVLQDIQDLDAYLIHEPGYTLLNDMGLYATNKDGVKTYQYVDIWKNIVTRKYSKRGNIFFGGFSGYDDTPRRGLNGIVIENKDINIFRDSFDKLVYKNLMNSNEYVFFNAWNEWGEGMYLEPDENDGISYLEAIRGVLDKYNKGYKSKGCGSIKNSFINGIKNKKNIKYEYYYHLLNKWLWNQENGNKIVDTFHRYGFKNIAIYGLGDLALHLIEELKNTSISISYILDKEQKYCSINCPMFTLKEKLPLVDAIIVTPIYDFYKIEKQLYELTKAPIISLEEIITES